MDTGTIDPNSITLQPGLQPRRLPESQMRTKRKRTLRACKYCHEHRIRCQTSDTSQCLHCLEYRIECIPRLDVISNKKRVSKNDREVVNPEKSMNTGESSTATAVESSITSGLVERRSMTTTTSNPTYFGRANLSQLIYICSQPDPSSIINNTTNPTTTNTTKTTTTTTTTNHPLAEFGARSGHLPEPFDYAPKTGLLVNRNYMNHDETIFKDSEKYLINVEERVAVEIGGESVLDRLQMEYHTNIEPFFPLFLSKQSKSSKSKSKSPNSNLSPYINLIRLIQCSLSALSRSVITGIREPLLRTLQNTLDQHATMRLLRISSLSCIQVYLLLSMADELHALEALEGQSLTWQRTGSSIRQAFELGLHRDISARFADSNEITQRRLAWIACVISDRWAALRFGQPPSIDLLYCDAPLFVTPQHINSGQDTTKQSFEQKLASLSIILGKILRFAIVPFEPVHEYDPLLPSIDFDLSQWLIQHVYASQSENSMNQDIEQELLNLFSIAVEFTFLRAVSSSSRSLPSSLATTPLSSRWQNLTERCERATLWLTTGRGWYYLDIWTMTTYPAVLCVIILLRQYQMNRDEKIAARIRLTQDAFRQWASRDQHLPRNGIRTRRDAIMDMIDTLTAVTVSLTGTHSPPPQEGSNAASSTANADDGNSFIDQREILPNSCDSNLEDTAGLSDFEIANFLNDPDILDLLQSIGH